MLSKCLAKNHYSGISAPIAFTRLALATALVLTIAPAFTRTLALAIARLTLARAVPLPEPWPLASRVFSLCGKMQYCCNSLSPMAVTFSAYVGHGSIAAMQ